MRVKAPQSINRSSQALGCSSGGLNKSLIENESEWGVIFALTTAGGSPAKHEAQTKNRRRS